MNDLERDLKDLLETKAGDVQPTPLAPPTVLRRGRRRQVGTVVGGAFVALAAVAVLIGGASTFLGDRAEAPPMGERDQLPARTATIGGVTVTAPQGWSLLDQSLWSMAISTETCTSSFEGTATPVGPGAGEGDVQPIGTPPVEECTPVDLPAGLPLFTLSNVEPNPTQTVCEVIPELPVQSVGPTDAYLYVAFDPTPEMRATWPVSLDTVLPGSCGTSMMAEWTVDGVGYFAAAAFGPEVSEAERQTVLDAFAGLDFGGSPQMATSPVIGFVMAAGVQDGVAWHLEAGPALTCESGGACVVQLALITTDSVGSEQAWPVTPPTTGSSIVSASQPVGSATIAFGAATRDVETVEIMTGDGSTATPTSVPWPSSLEAFASPEAPVDGTIWWASVPDVDTVNALLADGTTASASTGEASPVPPVQSDVAPSLDQLRLDTSIERDGRDLVATGEDLGSAWELRSTAGGHARFVAEGAEPLSFSTPNDGGTTVEVPAGSFLVWQMGEDSGPLRVVVDGTGETLFGRWMSSPDQMGRPGRLWLLPLPGTGTGLEYTSFDLPTAISWPRERTPEAGVVVSAGQNGEGVSWKFAYTSPDCLVLAQVAGDPSIGQTDCLAPVTDVPLVAHATGDRRSLIAFVAPGDVTNLSTDSLGERIYSVCSGELTEPGWQGVSLCAIVIPNDREVVLQPLRWDPEAKDDAPAGDPATVRVSDGKLFLTDGG